MKFVIRDCANPSVGWMEIVGTAKSVMALVAFLGVEVMTPVWTHKFVQATNVRLFMG